VFDILFCVYFRERWDNLLGCLWVWLQSPPRSAPGVISPRRAMGGGGNSAAMASVNPSVQVQVRQVRGS